MKTPLILLLPTLTILLTGCSSESARVTRIAEQAMQQQSAQNEEMARLNREIAEATEFGRYPVSASQKSIAKSAEETTKTANEITIRSKPGSLKPSNPGGYLSEIRIRSPEKPNRGICSAVRGGLFCGNLGS